MGTDIHTAVEYYDGDRWHSPHKWTRDEDGYGEHDEWYGDRCYPLFAILAGVRNGFGFAGVDWGDPVVPIAEPRGFPSDMAPETSLWSATVDHTPSWLSLSEMLAYDWTQIATLRGVVSAYEFAKWDRYWRRRGESPGSYCGDISGPGIEIVSEAEMRRRLDGVTPAEARERFPRLHARCEWTRPYHLCAAGWWSEMMPRLIHLRNQPGVEEVRVVFFFDG